jgi:hypothetical protein
MSSVGTARSSAAVSTAAETRGITTVSETTQISKTIYAGMMKSSNPVVSSKTVESTVQSEISMLQKMPGDAAKHGVEANAWKISRESRADGLAKMKADPTFGQGKVPTAKVGTTPEGYTIPYTYDAARLVTKPNANPTTFTSEVFTNEIMWTAPSGTRQTYKVVQRNDIDWAMVRTAGDRRFIGKTNLEAASAGHRPQLSDGYFATLHHLGQDSRGGLIEASTKHHSFKSNSLVTDKKYFDVIHGQHGYRRANPDFSVNHDLFDLETNAYWKQRAKDIQ